MKKLLLLFLLIISINVFGQEHYIKKSFTVVNEYIWENSIDNFTTVATKSIGEYRIINIAKDFSSVELLFVLGTDTVSILTQVAQMLETDGITVMYLMDKDDYPYLLESSKEGVYALYYKYKNDNSGYNGFHGGEQLKLN